MRWIFKATRATAGPVGFERRPADGEFARRIVRAMEDHRLLYAHSCREGHDYTIMSADRARRELGAILAEPDLSPRMEEIARAMQAAFRAFMDTHPNPQRSPWGEESFTLALGELRATVGALVGELSNDYGVSVNDDLAASVPNPNDFFFQRFPAEQ